ncbi:hypothetical protein CPB84DRAFT_1771094 [Gymnopilus junonius]|uniref:Uncharacterized protein n=1 Tax=Gymnopilus junonius TaxID=109634 RepID=A0A9P5NQQ3_GYMJU|nr:hypothetical protein CPB84DRAFT_1771094 [Gymnopilus junonius]
MASTRAISSTLTTISNHFKPHKAEAIGRLRANVLCLIATLIVSYLLPGSLPSIPTAVRTVIWAWEWVCILETALTTLLGYNILEATYAIKYPRTPLAPVTSPKKASPVIFSSNKTPKKAFVISPNASPQPQKPFTFSPSASTSLASASIALSSSTSGSNPTYAQSPLSTPSRVLHYSIPPSSSTNTQASSTSEYPYTPSPVISAYRAKHAGMDVGRPVDGTFLMRVLPDETSDSEE